MSLDQQVSDNPPNTSQADIPNQACVPRNPHQRPTKTLTELETENSRLQLLVAELLIKNYHLRKLAMVED